MGLCSLAMFCFFQVEVPNGEIISNINALRKDNTGCDLKQLFIGAEGTIGVVTGVSIVAAAKPKALNAVFFVLRISDTVQKLFVKAKSELSEILSAFELWTVAPLNVQWG
ncbi:CFC_collapsed_G0047680.mRNA.1.CDS.1 [Saccharomyces cerevisiae]|nr:CFC_collapsed_G0047680.mRNA.1.CDS.1 [Saccharomyces cerevisiae]